MTKKNEHRKNQLNRVCIAALGMGVLLLSSCAMPSRAVWSQIQREGLVRFMAAERLNRQVELDVSELDHDTTEYLAGYERVAGEEPSAQDPSPLDPGTPPNLLTALPVAGRSGQVISPHAFGKTVDVSAFSAGEEVRCPHSGLAFLVPRFPTSPVIIADSVSGEIRERMRFESPKVAPVPQRPEVPTLRSVKADGLTAERVVGRQDHVYSPYANRQQIVDVSGLKAGDKARCPFTNRIFVVPEFAPLVTAAAPSEVAKISQSIDFRVLGDAGQGDPGAVLGAAGKKSSADPSVPTAAWSEREGYVLSPFGGQFVDVSGKLPGVVVRCPFSGKLFRVPIGAD